VKDSASTAAATTGDWPRITIVTPTFNRVEYLEDCIESVLRQGYPNLEYIICDGGSKNPALFELIRRYEGRLAWWDSVPDRGHAEAIRRGFDRSSGEIMAWMCSDDFYLPGALHAAAQAFRQGPPTDIVYGHSLLVDHAGAVLREQRAIPYFELAAITTAGIHQPATFWTREIYNRVGGNVGGANWENVVYEPNVELFCRFQRAKARFRRIKYNVAALRMHDGTVNATQAQKVHTASRATLRKYYPVLGRPGVYRVVHALMRVYQIAALVAQGDGAFLGAALRARLARREA
jgi:glycosyltransferase involved in cell wall biosynthesis